MRWGLRRGVSFSSFGATRYDSKKPELTSPAIAAATDFVLSILPILFLWNVKLPKRVKVGICGIMALGFA